MQWSAKDNLIIFKQKYVIKTGVKFWPQVSFKNDKKQLIECNKKNIFIYSKVVQEMRQGD